MGVVTPDLVDPAIVVDCQQLDADSQIVDTAIV